MHQLDSSSAHCSISQAATESASVKCFLSAIGDCFATQRVAVDLSFNVVECCTLNEQYIRYEIAAEQEPSVDPPQRNAISVLMMAAKELKLPPPPPPPPKYLLHLKGMRLGGRGEIIVYMMIFWGFVQVLRTS